MLLNARKVYKPCNQVKLALQKLDVPAVVFLDKASVSKITGVINTYQKNYALQKKPVFYDVHVNPEYHQKAFMKINGIYESEGLALAFYNFFFTNKLFPFLYHHRWCDSISTDLETWENRPTKNTKLDTWDVLSNRKDPKNLCYPGFLQTDGMGVIVIKQNFVKGKVSYSHGSHNEDDAKYIESLTSKDLKKTDFKCVLIDPGRMDL